ncbi:Ltp family lipoprotein [Metabacillus sp. 84]|uniref:Ltp family lipoprotein n=1 Tax=Metabacillus sp. 84 TaxID=3404705 RepID=UPI003CF43EAF
MELSDQAEALTGEDMNGDGEVVEKAVEEPVEEVKKGEPVSEEPEISVSQQNAIQKANDYLDFSAFSKSGLVEQLTFEGFPADEAAFAVDSIEVDWKEQAGKEAKDYLDYSSFSRSSLIEQLEFEGFTSEEATYGADQVGL